jgi:hypothetical protein
MKLSGLLNPWNEMCILHLSFIQKLIDGKELDHLGEQL